MGIPRALVLLALVAAATRGPAIRDLAIATDGVQIRVSFQFSGGFDREVVDRIASGLPTAFVYDLELLRDRKRWWDDSVDMKRLEVIAMFNAVTREYLVNTKLDGRLIDSRTLRDPGDLERAMTRFTALPIFIVQPSSDRRRILVRARVVLGTNHWLGFIPTLKTTDWVESNKLRIRTPG